MSSPTTPTDNSSPKSFSAELEAIKRMVAFFRQGKSSDATEEETPTSLSTTLLNPPPSLPIPTPNQPRDSDTNIPRRISIRSPGQQIQRGDEAERQEEEEEEFEIEFERRLEEWERSRGERAEERREEERIEGAWEGDEEELLSSRLELKMKRRRKYSCRKWREPNLDLQVSCSEEEEMMRMD